MFCPSNQIGRFISGILPFFPIEHPLLSFPCHIVPKESYLALLHQLVHHGNTFLPDCPLSEYLPDIRYNRASGRLPQSGHPEHRPMSLVHTAPSNLPTDADSLSAPEAHHFILPELTDVGMFRLGQGSGSRPVSGQAQNPQPAFAPLHSCSD